MDYCISLKTLYEAGITKLHFGGEIVHIKDEDGDFYDLCKADLYGPDILLCDGEKLLDCEWFKNDNGKEFVAGTAENGGARVYLTKEEFDVAVFK